MQPPTILGAHAVNPLLLWRPSTCAEPGSQTQHHWGWGRKDRGDRGREHADEFARWTNSTIASTMSLPDAGVAAGGVLGEELDRLVLPDDNLENEQMEQTEVGPVGELILAGTAFGEFIFAVLQMRWSSGREALALGVRLRVGFQLWWGWS